MIADPPSCPYCDARLPLYEWRGRLDCPGCSRTSTMAQVERAATRRQEASGAPDEAQAGGTADVLRVGTPAGGVGVVGKIEE